MPGQDAPAPDRQQAQDDPQQGRVEELLEQAQEHVEEPEQEGREQDRRPGAAVVFQAGEDEAAEGELLADGRDQGEEPTATQRLGICDIIWPSDSLIDRRDREEYSTRAAAR